MSHFTYILFRESANGQDSAFDRSFSPELPLGDSSAMDDTDVEVLGFNLNVGEVISVYIS
jgi:hypothetical protein